jgi:heat shock protein HslJ
MRSITRIALLLVAVALGATACGSDSDSGDDASLTDTKWMLTQIGDGSTPIADGTEATIEFTDELAAGTTGCNNFSGSYSTDGDTLEFGAMASTKMACIDDAVNLQEQLILAALGATTSFAIDGDTLTLSDGSDTLLTFTRD